MTLQDFLEELGYTPHGYGRGGLYTTHDGLNSLAITVSNPVIDAWSIAFELGRHDLECDDPVDAYGSPSYEQLGLDHILYWTWIKYVPKK